MDSTFKLDRKKFTDICKSKLNKDHINICLEDINLCASEFGFIIKTYLNKEIACVIVDEKKLMLFKIKYGI